MNLISSMLCRHAEVRSILFLNLQTGGYKLDSSLSLRMTKRKVISQSVFQIVALTTTNSHTKRL
jgi:hypothetical protein